MSLKDLRCLAKALVRGHKPSASTTIVRIRFFRVLAETIEGRQQAGFIVTIAIGSDHQLNYSCLRLETDKLQETSRIRNAQMFFTKCFSNHLRYWLISNCAKFDQRINSQSLNQSMEADRTTAYESSNVPI